MGYGDDAITWATHYCFESVEMKELVLIWTYKTLETRIYKKVIYIQAWVHKQGSTNTDLQDGMYKQGSMERYP